MVMVDVLFSSARQLADLIRTRQVSAEAVLTAHLARIEAVNPLINAVVQVNAEAALEKARVIDSFVARGADLPPLAGVPFTVKDSIETAGMITTSGTLGRKHHVSLQTAPMVQRWLDQGAILIGKTNCPELVLPYETDNLVYGRSSNPYDLARSPGGSSGGEGAIIAAGGSPLGLTVDGGGSIRLATHFCGITGIKPTTGRIPRTGHFPPISGMVAPLSQPGPLARCVEDLILTLPLLVGEDGRDPSVVPMPLGDPHAVELNKLRVAYYVDDGVTPADAETADVVHQAAEVLRAAGCVVEAARPAGVDQASELMIGLFSADGGEGVAKLLAVVGTTEISPLIQAFQIRQRERALSTRDLIRLLGRWDGLRAHLLDFMQRYDLILCPNCATPAFTHGTTLTPEMFQQFGYTQMYNLTGSPAASVPVMLSAGGLPIGVQIVGRHWREDVVLRAALEIERAFGTFRPDLL